MAFPSTFLDIQNAVLQKARLDPTLDLQRTKDWINQSYTRVCVETEAIVVSATMTVTAGAGSYTFPFPVARIKQMQIQPYGSTLLNPPLVRTTLDELMNRRQSGGDVQQSPLQATHYALLGISDFELWPTPAAADTILIWYVQFPTPLVANGDVPVLEEPYASKLLEYGALTDAGDFNGDPSTIEWDNAFSDWFGRYQTHLERKQGVIPGQFHQWGDPWAASGYDPADAYGY
jgi:hypothetical protein